MGISETETGGGISRVLGTPVKEKFVLILLEILEGMLLFPGRCDKEGSTPRPAGHRLTTIKEESTKNEFNTEEARLTRTEKGTVS